MCRIALAGFLLAAITLGCASAPTPAASSVTVPENAHPAWRSLASAIDLDGEPMVAPRVDQELTLVVAFASWCPHCHEELAALGRMRKKEPAVRIIGLSAWEDWNSLSDADGLRDYVDEHAPWLQVAAGNDAIIEELGGIPKIPSLFVFSHETGELLRAYRRSEAPLPGIFELREELASFRGGEP